LLHINLDNSRSGIDLRLGLKAAGSNGDAIVSRAALHSGCLACGAEAVLDDVATGALPTNSARRSNTSWVAKSKF
jgi:hypothetical protein